MWYDDASSSVSQPHPGLFHWIVLGIEIIYRRHFKRFDRFKSKEKKIKWFEQNPENEGNRLQCHQKPRGRTTVECAFFLHLRTFRTTSSLPSKRK